MSILQRFLKSSGLYFLGNVLAKLIGFFMLPVFTGHLSPGELGYYDVANTCLNLFVTFLFLDVYVGIMRFIYDRKDAEDACRPIFNGLIIFLISLTLFTLSAFVARQLFPISFFYCIYGFGVCTVFNNLSGYLCRAFGRNALFAASGVGATLITATVNAVGLIFLHRGVEILYIASMLGLLFQIIVIESRLQVLRKMSIALYDRRLFADLYRFSLPLCLNSLAFWMLTSYGNVMIAQKLGLEQNGLFLIAVKFAMVINLVSMCFNMAWQEVAFEKGNDDADALSAFHSKAFNLLICFLGVGALCLIHVSSLLFPYMVASEYAAVREIIPLTVLSAALGVLSSFFGQLYAALKKTSVIMYSTLAAALVNVVCMPFFIAWWGLKGAALSLIASYAVNVCMRLLILRNHLSVRIDGTFLLLFAALLTLSLWIFYAGGWTINLFGIVLFLSVGLLYQRATAVALYRKAVAHYRRNRN